MLQAVKPIRFLHEKGLTHSDLKASSYLLDSVDNFLKVKLKDYGQLQKSLRPAVKTSHQKSVFRAPDPVESKASDVYSLGVIFFYIVTHEEPWHCAYLDFQPSHQVDDKLQALIKQCLEADPSKRPDLDMVENELSLVLLSYLCKNAPAQAVDLIRRPDFPLNF